MEFQRGHDQGADIDSGGKPNVAPQEPQHKWDRPSILGLARDQFKTLSSKLSIKPYIGNFAA
jgi:hypothetical protein